MKNENCCSSVAPINWELRRHNISCLFCSTAFGFPPGRFGWTARPKIASAFSKNSGDPKGRPITLFVSKVSACSSFGATSKKSSKHAIRSRGRSPRPDGVEGEISDSGGPHRVEEEGPVLADGAPRYVVGLRRSAPHQPKRPPNKPPRGPPP